MTQEIWSWLAPSPPCMWGSAMVAMVMSMMTTVVAIITEAVIIWRLTFGPSPAAAGAAEAFTGRIHAPDRGRGGRRWRSFALDHARERRAHHLDKRALAPGVDAHSRRHAGAKH